MKIVDKMDPIPGHCTPFQPLDGHHFRHVPIEVPNSRASSKALAPRATGGSWLRCHTTPGKKPGKNDELMGYEWDSVGFNGHWMAI